MPHVRDAEEHSDDPIGSRNTIWFGNVGVRFVCGVENEPDEFGQVAGPVDITFSAMIFAGCFSMLLIAAVMTYRRARRR